MLTSRGMRLIEVNARLGGDFVPYLGTLASGVDTAMAAADAAAGRAPDVSFPHRRVAAIRFLYPPHDLEVVSVAVNADAVRGPIYQADVMTAPGAKLRLPPRGYLARYGYVIAVADTVSEVSSALAGADRVITLDGRPLPRDPR
jgi:biotin carboxylase